MKDDTYNGWSNYETWNWKLWLDNDQGTYSYWQERVQDILSQAFIAEHQWETADQLRRSMLADELKQDCEDSMENFPTAGPFTDILNAGIGEINWNEIAESLIES